LRDIFSVAGLVLMAHRVATSPADIVTLAFGIKVNAELLVRVLTVTLGFLLPFFALGPSRTLDWIDWGYASVNGRPSKRELEKRCGNLSVKRHGLLAEQRGASMNG